MPVIIRAPGVQIGANGNFKILEKSNEKRRKSPLIIEGTNDANPAIGYEGQQDVDQKYCLVVRDEATGKVDIHETTMFNVIPFVQSARKRDLDTLIRQSGVKNWQQRTALGEAFGTKKAKTAITDVTRNRLDAEMLDGLESAIVQNVSQRTSNLPSAEERRQTIEAERPIPPYNQETSNVAEIYAIASIVSLQEFDLLEPLVEEIIECPESEKLGKLPFSDSDFINARVLHVLSEDSNIRPRLQVLYYLSFLRAVYQHRRSNSRQQLVEKIGELPPALFDGVLQRFSSARASTFGQSKDRSFVFDPFHIDKLLCFILALALHTNDFELDITPLAHELSVKSSKLATLLRNLGCTIRAPTAEELKVREIPSGSVSSYRLANLSAPLKLPDLFKRKRA